MSKTDTPSVKNVLRKEDAIWWRNRALPHYFRDFLFDAVARSVAAGRRTDVPEKRWANAGARPDGGVSSSGEIWQANWHQPVSVNPRETAF